jgi:hypothetical protein
MLVALRPRASDGVVTDRSGARGSDRLTEGTSRRVARSNDEVTGLVGEGLATMVARDLRLRDAATTGMLDQAVLDEGIEPVDEDVSRDPEAVSDLIEPSPRLLEGTFTPGRDGWARSGSRKLGGEHVDHLDGRLLGE